MKKDTFVDTELRTSATEELARDVEDELNEPDLTSEEAMAAFRKALEDNQEGT